MNEFTYHVTRLGLSRYVSKDGRVWHGHWGSQRPSCLEPATQVVTMLRCGEVSGGPAGRFSWHNLGDSDLDIVAWRTSGELA